MLAAYDGCHAGALPAEGIIPLYYALQHAYMLGAQGQSPCQYMLHIAALPIPLFKPHACFLQT